MSAKKMGRPKKPPKFREVLKELIPAEQIFEPDEMEMYEGLVSVYLGDFDEQNLTANDMDDIMSIAMNRVLEIRLLKASKGSADMQIDVSAAIEKLRKQTEKLKENLATRRKDRIDPRKHSDFSIVNIAVAYDMERKQEQMRRSSELQKEEDEVLKSNRLVGNRDDDDASIIEEE
jgi:hypothetical protein